MMQGLQSVGPWAGWRQKSTSERSASHGGSAHGAGSPRLRATRSRWEPIRAPGLPREGAHQEAVIAAVPGAQIAHARRRAVPRTLEHLDEVADLAVEPRETAAWHPAFPDLNAMRRCRVEIDQRVSAVSGEQRFGGRVALPSFLTSDLHNASGRQIDRL